MNTHQRICAGVGDFSGKGIWKRHFGSPTFKGRAWLLRPRSSDCRAYVPDVEGLHLDVAISVSRNVPIRLSGAMAACAEVRSYGVVLCLKKKIISLSILPPFMVDAAFSSGYWVSGSEEQNVCFAAACTWTEYVTSCFPRKECVENTWAKIAGSIWVSIYLAITLYSIKTARLRDARDASRDLFDELARLMMDVRFWWSSFLCCLCEV